LTQGKGVYVFFLELVEFLALSLSQGR